MRSIVIHDVPPTSSAVRRGGNTNFAVVTVCVGHGLETEYWSVRFQLFMRSVDNFRSKPVGSKEFGCNPHRPTETYTAFPSLSQPAAVLATCCTNAITHMALHSTYYGLSLLPPFIITL